MASVSLEVASLGAAKSDADADAAAAVAVLLVEEYGGLVGGGVGIADTDMVCHSVFVTVLLLVAQGGKYGMYMTFTDFLGE